MALSKKDLLIPLASFALALLIAIAAGDATVQALRAPQAATGPCKHVKKEFPGTTGYAFSNDGGPFQNLPKKGPAPNAENTARYVVKQADGSVRLRSIILTEGHELANLSINNARSIQWVPGPNCTAENTPTHTADAQFRITLEVRIELGRLTVDPVLPDSAFADGVGFSFSNVSFNTDLGTNVIQGKKVDGSATRTEAGVSGSFTVTVSGSGPGGSVSTPLKGPVARQPFKDEKKEILSATALGQFKNLTRLVMDNEVSNRTNLVDDVTNTEINSEVNVQQFILNDLQD